MTYKQMETLLQASMLHPSKLCWMAPLAAQFSYGEAGPVLKPRGLLLLAVAQLGETKLEQLYSSSKEMEEEISAFANVLPPTFLAAHVRGAQPIARYKLPFALLVLFSKWLLPTTRSVRLAEAPSLQRLTTLLSENPKLCHGTFFTSVRDSAPFRKFVSPVFRRARQITCLLYSICAAEFLNVHRLSAASSLSSVLYTLCTPTYMTSCEMIGFSLEDIPWSRLSPDTLAGGADFRRTSSGLFKVLQSPSPFVGLLVSFLMILFLSSSAGAQAVTSVQADDFVALVPHGASQSPLFQQLGGKVTLACCRNTSETNKAVLSSCAKLNTTVDSSTAASTLKFLEAKLAEQSVTEPPKTLSIDIRGVELQYPYEDAVSLYFDTLKQDDTLRLLELQESKVVRLQEAESVRLLAELPFSEACFFNVIKDSFSTDIVNQVRVRFQRFTTSSTAKLKLNLYYFTEKIQATIATLFGKTNQKKDKVNENQLLRAVLFTNFSDDPDQFVLASTVTQVFCENVSIETETCMTLPPEF